MRPECPRKNACDPNTIRTACTMIALMASIAINVAYSRRLQTLSAGTAASPSLGQLIESTRLEVAGGVQIDLVSSLPRRPTVVYYFSPTCQWCERNWLNVTALERGARDRYRFLALTETDEVRTIIHKHKLAFEVYGGLKSSARLALGLSGTPQTLVISPDGRVLTRWIGAYNARVRDELERYFAVLLPGLT